MSKAFTNEDAVASTPDVRSRPWAGEGPRYVTPEGRAALERDQERLLDERKRAAAGGTIGSAQLADLDAQLAALAQTLESLTVVEPDPAQAGRVFFGAWVTLEDEEGEIVRYRIVGPDEADAKAGLISAASPLGRALLGKEEGDTAVVERPRGPAEYTIRAVDYR